MARNVDHNAMPCDGRVTVATRTETIFTYICDLCGSEHDDQAAITPIYVNRPRAQSHGVRDRRCQVDVCDGCLGRPIADVLAFCAGRYRTDAGSPARPGVVRIADR